MTSATLRVEQRITDRTISPHRVARLHSGDFLGDGMSGPQAWTWTRVRVVAIDRQAKVIVVRFPDGEYSVNEWEEATRLYVDWKKVSDRPAVPMTGSTWAADADC